MNRPRDTSLSGTFSIRDLDPMSRRDADLERASAEQNATAVPKRHRRKIGRTEVMSLRTFPEIKRLIIAMADVEQKSLVEIVEDAIRLRDRALRGER